MARGSTPGDASTSGTVAGSIQARDVRFDRLFVEHRGDVWRYCSRRVDSSEVNDAVADVFVVVWRRVEELPADEQARLWIYGIARNVIRNRQRSARRRHRLNGRLVSLRAVESPSTDDVAVRRSEHRELLEAVDRLPADDRELLRLHTWEELSMAEISTVTGKSVRSVESKLSRIRKKLARTLGDTTASSVDRGGSVRSAHPPGSTVQEMWSSPTRREGGER